MRLLQTLAGLWCIACLAVVACGQEVAEPVAEPMAEAASAPTTAVAMPKPEPVLSHIPADVLGYVVVHDVGATMGRVDQYLTDIGLAEMVASAMPNGALEAIKLQTMLGEGFNPSGGFAVVMLNPESFGVNLLAMMGLEEEEPATQPQTTTVPGEGVAVPPPPKLPVVILVPGMSVESVFGNYEIAPGEKYSEVLLRMGPMFATQMGGYVCLSPSAEALDALAGATGQALPAEQADLIARSDLAIYLNTEVASPLLNKLLGKVQEQMQYEAGPFGIWSVYLGFYKDLFSQMTGLSVGGRFVPTGVVLEGAASFKPDSTMGQALSTFQPTGGNLLARVSSPKYVFALGVGEKPTQATEQERALVTDMMDTILAVAPFSLLDEQAKADLKTLALDLTDQQAGGMQMVIGGAPEGSGLFAASMVFQCKDSAGMKDLLLGSCPLIETLIKTIAEEEDLPFRIVATRQVATVDGLPVDAIEIALVEEEPQTLPTEPGIETQPEAEPMPMDEESPAPAEEEAATSNQAPLDEPAAPEETPAEPAPTEEIIVVEETEEAVDPIITVMGEDKIRFYLVAPDPQTLIITFGGGQTYLAEAVRVAKAGDGTILADPAVTAALEVLPKNLAEVGLINVGNLFDVIRHAVETMEGPGAGPPFRIESQAPVAFGASISGTSTHVVYYIPNELVSEVVGIIKSFAAPPPPTTESAPTAPEDF